MTEKVLHYNRDLVSQETGYWCGPASAQMCLSNRGIHIDEAQLARECRTHEGGTDYLGLIENVLNQHIHDADYVTVQLHNDPPLPHEVDQMWTDLRTSIDAGFGVVGNFVSPANNPPIGVKGSQSPNGYGRSTIYHYVSFHGYSQEGDFRAVWVADSGFQPSGYWLTLEQTALLCAGKGYTYARPHGVPGVPDPIGPDDAQLLSHAMGDSLGIDRYRALLPGVREALAKSHCDNVYRIAHWFSQIGHESAGLRYMEELADGSAYEGRADLGNTQPGDGVRFKGHGPIQITGRHNHAAVSQWAFDQGIVPSADYFVEFPNELGSDRYGFMGAAWYWTVARGNAINEAADRGADGIGDVTRLINGGHHGIEDRTQRYHRALEVASAFLPQPVHQAAPPEPEPVHLPPPAPPLHTGGQLSDRPRHHSVDDDALGHILSMRAEVLLTQALVFALAERAGINARELYDNVRGSF